MIGKFERPRLKSRFLVATLLGMTIAKSAVLVLWGFGEADLCKIAVPNRLSGEESAFLASCKAIV